MREPQSTHDTRAVFFKLWNSSMKYAPLFSSVGKSPSVDHDTIDTLLYALQQYTYSPLIISHQLLSDGPWKSLCLISYRHCQYRLPIFLTIYEPSLC
ncbi:hypothetical protein AN958_00463 [Leucoagaricus sp. SymC.cos]|nr:hypothetical protein AN958_00463 [Leucoagaricus sp. SymC.cos]